MIRPAGFGLALVATAVMVLTWGAGPGWKGACLVGSFLYVLGFLVYVLFALLASAVRGAPFPKGETALPPGVWDREIDGIDPGGP